MRSDVIDMTSGFMHYQLDIRSRNPSAPTQLPERFAASPIINADQAQALAEATIPGASAGYLSPPTQQRNAWQVGLQGVGGDPRLRSRSLVWIDPTNGAVLRQLGEGQGPFGARMEKDLIWLHGGAIFGLGGRLLAVLAGLSLPVLWTTGLLFWLRRRRLRQATPRPAMARAA